MICGKKIYTTKGAANKAAKSNNEKRKETYHSYACEPCGEWHITSGRRTFLKGSQRKAQTKAFQKLKNRLRRR